MGREQQMSLCNIMFGITRILEQCSLILPVNFRSKDDLSMRTRLVWSAPSFSSVIVGGVNAFAQPCFLSK